MVKSVQSCVLTVLIVVIGASCHLTDAKATTFYVAPNGLDRNPGTETKPFATIQRAQQAVRLLISQGLDQDILVMIGYGTYWVPNGLQFGPEDTGTGEHSITYQAEGNGPVALIGGVRITDWQRHSGNVFVAHLPSGTTGTQLFENDQRLTLARAPNEGYFRLAGQATQGQYLAFEYQTSDFDPTGWDISEAQVNIWPEHDWSNFDYNVLSLDPNAHTITLDTAVRKVIPGNRYAIKNVLALLDCPGECCIFRKAGFVYAWPTSGESSMSGMILATADSVIHIRGQEGRIVRNLHFQGLDIGICQGNTIEISLAEDCSVRFCKIENAGKTGVYITDHAQGIEIYGNLIRWHGQDGVSLRGRAMGREDVSHHNRIENNHIHHCGQLIGHGCGVYLRQSGFNQVLNNHIHHMPRYGTTIKGNRYGTVKGTIPGMTWENRYDYMYGRNNRIAFNDIHHTNLDSQDTGAMESWAPGRDNQYDHNLIHDTGNTEFDLQSGIYLDDQADYFTVTSNIIYGVVGTRTNQCIYAKGIGNRIENNILVGSPICDTGIRSFFMVDERCDNHTYLHNIFFFEAGSRRSDLGSFGSGVGNIHAKGTTLTWDVNVPKDDSYTLWLRYACLNQPYGYDKMDGRCAVHVDSGSAVLLTNLPDTGGWGTYCWSMSATLALTKGWHCLHWENIKGGGINIDALVLCTDPAWVPMDVMLPPPTEVDHAMILIQAEAYSAKNGQTPDVYAYAFVNWSDDRVYASDYNLLYSPNGRVTIQGGPANGSWDTWCQILDKRFDQHSIMADPLFVNPASHDYRLQESSPALPLGFKPINTSQIGLHLDFPSRFERE